MTLSVRNPEADALARRLAQLDQTTITEAIVVALKEAIQKRVQQERPSETAQRLLAKRGLGFRPGRQPVPDSAWHELDHDIAGEA
jgi:antitoxin VapB